MQNDYVDSRCRKILKYMKTTAPNAMYRMGSSTTYPELTLMEMAKNLSLSPIIVHECVEHLEHLGYINFYSSDSGETIFFRLSQKALLQQEYQLHSFARYLLNNWIAILALVVAILSLCVSLGFLQPRNAAHSESTATTIATQSNTGALLAADSSSSPQSSSLSERVYPSSGS